MTEDSKADLDHYPAAARRIIVSAIRQQLAHEPPDGNKEPQAVAGSSACDLRTSCGAVPRFLRRGHRDSVGDRHFDRTQSTQRTVRARKAGAIVITVDLGRQEVNLSAVLSWARREPVLLVAPDGQAFYVAEADDFEREVETLRQSRAFQEFLAMRSSCPRRIPLEEIERELQESP